jgi:hypothetical protein
VWLRGRQGVREQQLVSRAGGRHFRVRHGTRQTCPWCCTSSSLKACSGTVLWYCTVQRYCKAVPLPPNPHHTRTRGVSKHIHLEQAAAMVHILLQYHRQLQEGRLARHQLPQPLRRVHHCSGRRRKTGGGVMTASMNSKRRGLLGWELMVVVAG